MKTTTEKLNEKSKKVFMELYYQGMSIHDIQTLGDNLVRIGEDAIENPENTINKISNGQLKING
jgi:hypothetical protein